MNIFLERWMRKKEVSKVKHLYLLSFSQFKDLIYKAMREQKKPIPVELCFSEDLGPLNNRNKHLWTMPDGWTGDFRRIVVYYGTFLKCSECLKIFRDRLDNQRDIFTHMVTMEVLTYIRSEYLEWDMCEYNGGMSQREQVLFQNICAAHEKVKKESEKIKQGIVQRQEVSCDNLKKYIDEYTMYLTERRMVMNIGQKLKD